MQEKEKECKQKCYIAMSEAEIEIQGGSRDAPNFPSRISSLFVGLCVVALLSAVQARLLGRNLLPNAVTTKLL